MMILCTYILQDGPARGSHLFAPWSHGRYLPVGSPGEWEFFELLTSGEESGYYEVRAGAVQWVPPVGPNLSSGDGT